MSQEVQAGLKQKTQQLMDGPLKHIRGAALAAALVPLASIAVAPASAQGFCGSGGTFIHGIAFNDANHTGIQALGQTGVEGVKVTACALCDRTDDFATETGPDGTYIVGLPPGTYRVAAQIPT